MTHREICREIGKWLGLACVVAVARADGGVKEDCKGCHNEMYEGRLLRHNEMYENTADSTPVFNFLFVKIMFPVESCTKKGYSVV